MKRILLLGGAGFCGSKLAIHLMQKGYEVTIYDILTPEWLASYIGAGVCHAIQGDVRDLKKLNDAMKGQNAVIHLACISNDPASELNPELTKSINLDSFPPCVQIAKECGVKRFIFASSSSVYGVRPEKDVVETTPLTPLTDYSRYKADCEKILLDNKGDMEAVVIRPATVCGMSPNLRLDLCVHILTMAALRNGVIKVFGGDQYRPNIHIDDLIEVYERLLTADNVDGAIFNCGSQNLTIHETALMVRNVVGQQISIIREESADERSYHVSSDKIKRALRLTPMRPIGQAIFEIKDAYMSGLIPEPDASKYHRIKWWKEQNV